MIPAKERPTSIEQRSHEPARFLRRAEMSPEQNSFQPFGQNHPKANTTSRLGALMAAVGKGPREMGLVSYGSRDERNSSLLFCLAGNNSLETDILIRTRAVGRVVPIALMDSSHSDARVQSVAGQF